MNRFLFISILSLFCFNCKQNKEDLEARGVTKKKVKGAVFGTFYQITYADEVDYGRQFDSLFFVINKSMSTYQEDSDISKINRNEFVKVDNHFKNVFSISKTVYEETKGAFDPTIGALVNAWDFGPMGKIENLDSLKIENLMQSVGFNKVSIMDQTVIKHPNSFIDFNAIAKGYAVDVISKFLDIKNISNYMVYIGGELKAKGINIEKNAEWTVGIENPNFDGTQSWDKILVLKDAAMATSGTYRKYKIDENGNKYAHIINAKTGYPSKTNILSISVIAKDCVIADAYATALKTMSIKEIKLFLQAHQELKVFLIFENENKGLETLVLNNFPNS